MSHKTITPEDVKYVAELSNLPLSESELGAFAKMFSETLEYIDVLDELDTTHVDRTYQVTGQENVFMPDDVDSTTLSAKEALQNAITQQENLFVTKGVFERTVSL